MNIEEPNGNLLKLFEHYDKALKMVVVHGQTYTRTIGSQQNQQKET